MRPDALAAKFGLILALPRLADRRPHYLVQDRPVAEMVLHLPVGAWNLKRFDDPPRLVPRHGV